MKWSVNPLRLGIIASIGLSACVQTVQVPPPKIHYVEIPCELPSGITSKCRIAQWQPWKQVYWQDGQWHASNNQVTHFWLFEKAKYH